MSFVARWFGGGGESSSSNQGTFVGGPRGPLATNGPLVSPSATAASSAVSGNPLLRGKTKTKFTGPLGLSTQADTAKKTLLGQ